MPLLRPDGPRPIVDGSNTTIQDYTDDLIALRDIIVRLSDRAKSADETQMEAEYRALLLLNERFRETLERAQKTSRNFDHSIRVERDKWKRDRRDRRVVNIMQG